MITQQAIVIESSPQHLLLRPVESGCQGCKTSSCGVNAFAGLFGKRERLLRVANPGGYQTGQSVQVMMEERLFVRLILLQYVLPLILMLAIAIVGSGLTANLYMHILFAVGGLLGGIVISRQLIHRLEQRLPAQLVQLQPGTNSELFISKVNS